MDGLHDDRHGSSRTPSRLPEGGVGRQRDARRAQRAWRRPAELGRWSGLRVVLLVAVMSAVLVALLGSAAADDEEFDRDRIRPYGENPFYWQYRGQPVLLVGGTHDDNPFNNPSHDPVAGRERLEDHLDLLVSAGGNYVRNTMSHRDVFSVYPYLREPDAFADPMDDPDAWQVGNGRHARVDDGSFRREGALAVWSEAPGNQPVRLRRELPATDMRNGTVEAWFWVRGDEIASSVEAVRVRLASPQGSATVTWPGEVMAGWHLIDLHVRDFDGEGFHPGEVTAVELEVALSPDASLEQGDLLWDDLAVRGRFDLDRFNPEYWDRLEAFLEQAHERDIIVQIELWDKVELFDAGSSSSHKWDPRRGWRDHPFNPANNVNYTAESSGLREVVDWSYHPRGDPPLGDQDLETIHPFFYTPPTVAELLPGGDRPINSLGLSPESHRALVETVLPYQEAFVARVLEASLPYPNVLYTINNETFLPTSDWSDHWARFLHERAREHGRRVEVGDMRGESRFDGEPPHAHAHIVSHPELYTFVDASQNTTTKPGDGQWRALQWLRDALAAEPAGPRPITNTKIYDFRPSSTDATARDFQIEKYWRNLLGGASSARFHRRMGAALHRPLDGDGTRITDETNEPGLANFASAAMFAEAFEPFSARPDLGVLHDRESGEAYAMVGDDGRLAVYVPAGGDVIVDLPDGTWEVRWLDILAAEWREPEMHEGGGRVGLSAPVAPHALAVVRPTRE